LREHARGDGNGIGGGVASKSDVVTNGCAECGFGETTVEIFALDAPARSEDTRRRSTRSSVA
jgi:hypothetical protein